MQASYNQYESSNGGDYDDEPTHELIVTTYSALEGDLAATFGTDGEFGQSLGTVFENVEIVDGCLYADPEKEKFKLFSWQESNDMSPTERLERGEDPDVDDANDFIRKTYAGTSKEYELVGARVPEVTGEDGEVLVEASSKVRDVEFTDDGVDFGDWTDLDGDNVPFGNAIMWYGGSTDNGPSISATELAEVLMQYGEDAVVDEDNIHGWLRDTTSNNVVREDLEGERLRFFIVQRDGEKYPYNLPIVEHVETGERIHANNYGGNSIDESEAERDPDAPTGGNSGSAASSTTSGSYPEPIADFLQSGDNLDLDEDRASKILDDLLADSDNSLTEDMVEDNGGRDHLIEQVV